MYRPKLHGNVRQIRQIAMTARNGINKETRVPPDFIRRDYEPNELKERLANPNAADTGTHPSRLQRRMLSILGFYPSINEVPYYVSAYTLNKLYNREKMLGATTLLVFAFFYFNGMNYFTGGKGEEHRMKSEGGDRH